MGVAATGRRGGGAAGTTVGSGATVGRIGIGATGGTGVATPGLSGTAEGGSAGSTGAVVPARTGVAVGTGTGVRPAGDDGSGATISS